MEEFSEREDYNISSSWISRATYNRKTQELNISTIAGKTYTLTGVPPDVVEAFVHADSPGSYFNDQLRGNY
jgi:KTSC domain